MWGKKVYLAKGKGARSKEKFIVVGGSAKFQDARVSRECKVQILKGSVPPEWVEIITALSLCQARSTYSCGEWLQRWG